MLIRKFHLLIAAHLICTSVSQNARSYDTNDWIPITQKTSEDVATPKKPTGRVLNLDAPAQKFFPDEFLYKKSRPNFQSRPKHKERYNVPKYENTYKFEVPPSHPQNSPPPAAPPKFQYQYPQEVKLPNYQQPPPLDIYRPPPPRAQYVPNAQALQAPPPNQPITYQQYQPLPAVQTAPSLQGVPAYNTTFYQTINPLSINQELVGGIQYQNIQEGQEKHILQNPESIPNENLNGAKDNVQLVYVPLENLKGNQQVQVQPVPQDSQNIYRQIESPRYETPIDRPHRLAAIEQDFIHQALQATKLQEQIQHGEPLYFQISTTTPKSIKKRKPHQPPLAVYLEGEKQQADITDVLSALHEVKTIAVQDSIQPGSPEIFIGPSSLESPEYTKFPLPYLNSIEGNRLKNNIDNLPFLVAPQNFKTPPGFSKIPLPAPHVGSVVVSNKEDLHGKRSTPRPNLFQTEGAKQLGKDDIEPVTEKTESFTAQPYYGQTYYDQNPFVSSPQPQLLQFAINGQNKQHNVPNGSYNPQIVGNEYNLPLKSQPEVTTQFKNVDITENSKALPESSFQYSYIEENQKANSKNTYNSPKPTDDIRYDTPSTSLSYTGPQTYDDEDRRPYQQQYSDFSNSQKQQKDQYRLGDVQQVRYEPISTTFDASRPNQDEYNIKPNTEAPPRQKTNNYENQQKPQLPDVSPLELAINEFELHQINTQLEEKPRVKNQYNYKTQDSKEDTEYRFDPELHRFASTPASILRDTYETTTRPTIKSRNRIRTRPKTSTLPPSPEVEEEAYTVLEDFSVKKKPQSSVQYTAQQEDVQTEQLPSQQNYKNPNYSDSFTEIENIPTKVYSLSPNKNTPAYTAPPTAEHSYTLNQNLMDQQILQSGVRQSSPNYEQQGQFEVDPHEYTIQPNVESTKAQQVKYTQDINQPERPNTESTREHLVEYTQDSYIKEQERPDEYTSSLDDPSVRTLLVPKLLVPTTTNDDVYTGPGYLPTTEKIRSTVSTTTTERPIETTTQSRVRSRTRGGSRYNTYSTTKRAIVRRRPTSRVTTERSTRYTQENDYSTKSTVAKSRFRTRGRTTPNSITERHSTTENEIHEVPTSEPAVKFRTHPDGSESYSHYEHSVDPEKIITIKPEEQEYSRVYSTSTRPIIQYENTASTSRPNINVQVTHPEDEEIHKEKVRVRGRIRDRPRSSSTSTERIVTRRIIDKPTVQKGDSDDEFYGFFRKPDFGAPTETPIEVPTTTPRHRVFAYQTPSQHGEDYQLNLDSTHTETSTVRFIGEIVPKYTTSREIITETETPRPRIRTRTRTPQRKPQVSQEQSTRRTNIIRTRGKTHYKVPENLKKNKDDDVEGGNYPASFLQGRRGITTPSPSFQITVAPDEEDQALNPSLYRPNVIARPQEWHDASEFYPEDQKKTDTNALDTEENSSKLTDDSPDQPFALPVKAITEKVAETTLSSDETFKETTKQIEEQFEAINNFDNERDTEINTEKPTKQKRRKGVWKLVKHQPVDRLETSESQNYFSVLNSFHDIQKVNGEDELDHDQQVVNEKEQNFNEDSKDFQLEDLEIQTENYNYTYAETTTILPEQDPVTTFSYEDRPTTTTNPTISKEEKEEDFLDSIYEMFGMSRLAEEKSTSSPTSEAETTSPITTTLNPTFPEELTEVPSSSSTVNVTEAPSETETTTFPLEDFFTTPQLEAKHEIKTSTFDVKPWDMREVRTSTSTEVSHETEICYKGRCIRSHDRKKRL